MDDPLPDSKSILLNNAFLTFEPYLYIGLIILLTVFSAFFSAIETSYACLNQFKIKAEAEDGDKKAQKIIKAYERFDKTLIMSLIGHNLMNVIMSAISTVLAMLLFNSIFDDALISVISTVVITLITYIFGDMVPKIIARETPEKVAYNTLGMMTFFYYLFYPLIIVFSGFTNLANTIFKVNDIPEIDEEDFNNVIEEIEEEGLIEENESEIIANSFDFSDTKVRDILTKREKMYVIDIKGLKKDKLNDILIDTPYSRIPVVYGSKDKVIGVLHVKSYIKAYIKDPNISIQSTLQKPYFVSTRVKLDDILDGFKEHHTHIAIVRNNEEKVLGMVTMEDVLEELVGKIAEPNVRVGKEE